jgi:predicted DNA-binding transcriptional regulator AlpA
MDTGLSRAERGRKLQTRDLCARYGVSDRSIDRWLADERLNFPRPMRINGRRFWSEADVDAFDAVRKAVASAEQAEIGEVA